MTVGRVWFSDPHTRQRSMHANTNPTFYFFSPHTLFLFLGYKTKIRVLQTNLVALVQLKIYLEFHPSYNLCFFLFLIDA